MAGVADLLAVVYAYLLAFIILTIIVASLRASMWLLSRREAKPSAAPAATAAPKPEVVEEAAKPPATSRIAAAVAAVATHLSLQRVGPSASATASSLGPVPQPWVHQWRVQVNKSLNELCLIRFLHRRPQTA